MTVQETKILLASLREIFDTARIVDPETRQTWDVDADGVFRPVDICYRVWKK